MTTVFLDHPGPLAFAHRGGAAHAPENSWRAFEHAVGLGYSYLETDIQATADGVLVAFHDRTLTRVAGRPGRVSRLPHAELAQARIHGTEPIPRLEDLLAAWPRVRFNLDLKAPSAIRALNEVLRRTAAWDRVCVCSFSASRLRAARRALERPVCMAASPFGAMMVRLGGPRGHTGSRGRTDSRGPHRPPGGRPAGPSPAGTPRAGQHSPGPAPDPRRLTDWLARTGIRCVQMPAATATRPFITRAHALGLQVHVWTVNDRPAMARLLDYGADGIMTDDTVTLRDVLAERGQWHSV